MKCSASSSRSLWRDFGEERLERLHHVTEFFECDACPVNRISRARIHGTLKFERLREGILHRIHYCGAMPGALSSAFARANQLTGKSAKHLLQ
jgi:hypothetical protein